LNSKIFMWIIFALFSKVLILIEIKLQETNIEKKE